MNAKRVIALASLCGVLVPLLCILIERLFPPASPSSTFYRLFWTFSPMIWPGNLPFSLAACDVPMLSFLFLALVVEAILINVIIYVFLATMIWVGVKKYEPLLTIPVLLIAAWWIFVGNGFKY